MATPHNLTRRGMLKGALAVSAATVGVGTLLASTRRLNYIKGSGTDQQMLGQGPRMKPHHLSDIAEHCRATSIGNLPIWANVREFIVAHSRQPQSFSSVYYSSITNRKNWDVVVSDMWGHYQGRTAVAPELLCFDATDLFVMILAELGVEARSVRGIAARPKSVIGKYPMYLDHTFAEVWTGSSWSAQDPFYNVSFRHKNGNRASLSDLCSISDLNNILPRNQTARGWSETGADVLAAQDFYAAVEYRDLTGESIVLMNRGRADFNQLFMVSKEALPTPLGELIISSVVNKTSPTIIEFG